MIRVPGSIGRRANRPRPWISEARTSYSGPAAARERSAPTLAARLGNRHDLEEVPRGILEVEAAPAPPPVDPAVGGLVGLAAVGEPPGLHAGEDRLVLRVLHVERVVVGGDLLALVEVVGEVQRQVLVDPHLGEVAAGLDREAEDLGEELGRGVLVAGGHDRMVQSNRHGPYITSETHPRYPP